MSYVAVGTKVGGTNGLKDLKSTCKISNWQQWCSIVGFWKLLLNHFEEFLKCHSQSGLKSAASPHGIAMPGNWVIADEFIPFSLLQVVVLAVGVKSACSLCQIQSICCNKRYCLSLHFTLQNPVMKFDHFAFGVIQRNDHRWSPSRKLKVPMPSEETERVWCNANCVIRISPVPRGILWRRYFKCCSGVCSGPRGTPGLPVRHWWRAT